MIISSLSEVIATLALTFVFPRKVIFGSRLTEWSSGEIMEMVEVFVVMGEGVIEVSMIDDGVGMAMGLAEDD